MTHIPERSCWTRPKPRPRPQNRATAEGKNFVNMSKSSVVFDFAIYRDRGSRFLLELNRDRDHDRDRDRERGNNWCSKTAIAV